MKSYFMGFSTPEVEVWETLGCCLAAGLN